MSGRDQTLLADLASHALPSDAALRSRDALQLAALAWLAMWIVPAVRILRGRLHSVAFRVYMKAGLSWWFHGSLYDLGNIDGFQYFPQAAWVFSPFWWLGSPLCDLTWRALEWALYGLAVWRVSRSREAEGGYAPFVLLSALALAPAINSLFSGQVNLALAALLLLASAAIMAERWSEASVWLVLGVVLKPLMLAPLALLWLAFPALRLWTCVGLTLALLLPFLLRSPEYVSSQYAECLLKLRLSADPDRQFEDLRGLLHRAHVELAPVLLLALRVLVAAAVALACRRLRRHADRPVLLICALSANCLVLLNPRTQPNSYVIVAVFAAAFALQASRERRWASALWCTLAVIAWSLHPRMSHWSKLWLRPLASVVFFVVLALEAQRAFARKRTPRDLRLAASTSVPRHAAPSR